MPSNFDMLCLNCTLFQCHKGSNSCLIKKAEMDTKQYWVSRYDGRGRKFQETRRRIEAKRQLHNSASIDHESASGSL